MTAQGRTVEPAEHATPDHLQDLDSQPANDPPPTLRYVNGRARGVMVTYGLLFAVLMGAALSTVHGAGSTIAILSLLLTGVAMAFRAATSHVLILNPEKVTTKNMLRTHSWRYAELRTAVSSSGQVGLYDRRFLTIFPREGKPYKFTALSEDPKVSPVMEEAVAEIQRRIASSDLES